MTWLGKTKVKATVDRHSEPCRKCEQTAVDSTPLAASATAGDLSKAGQAPDPVDNWAVSPKPAGRFRNTGLVGTLALERILQ